ncbi:MAG: S9 family peptidase [Odoribacteraceae bacterium]|jgi:dipeptidyl aminopeptidase/acylaminoacyl peptidase|nr:S9 family peptidase [Odoribacteraceae bacterium]
MKKPLRVALILITAVACEQAPPVAPAPGYKPAETKLASDIMTPEVLWSFGRMGEFKLSPDGATVLYPVTYFHKEENRSYTDLYLLRLADGHVTRLTDTDYNEAAAAWTPDGKIAFLAPNDGATQLWEINPDGAALARVTDIEGGIDGFLYAPDKSRLLYLKEVKLEQDIHDLHPDLPKANARLVETQFYRHWDGWVDAYTHPFVADLDPGALVTGGKDILQGERWESPVRPFGGTEQLAWTNDSRAIIYTARKKQGIDYARSTNTDLYLHDIITGSTVNLTEGMMGYDNNPLLSPDGSLLAWESMEREGYEADKPRLFIMNLVTGEKRDYTRDFDQHVAHLAWADNNTLYFISDHHATDEIYRLTLHDGKILKITEGTHNYTSVAPAGDILLASRVSMSKPAELYKVNPATGQAEELTFINKPILDQLTLGNVESRWIPTTDGKQMLTWIIYPPRFDPSKRYPTILYCEGGPQSTVSQFWSYRWNFQMMVANGYIVVAPNRRGLPGFGQQWLEQISGDYPGQNMQDYLTAIDALAREPYVDANRLACIGASYGGYSVYHLAGHHQKRFKAFIAHCGIYNLEMQYATTEEMWFADWDLGGAPWDDNRVARRTYANSPHRFAGNWDTPILVIHGQRDFRIDVSQGMAAFNTARMRGIPAQYLYFPEESHWVLGCQNGILWQRTFAAWLDRWLKTE